MTTAVRPSSALVQTTDADQTFLRGRAWQRKVNAKKEKKKKNKRQFPQKSGSHVETSGEGKNNLPSGQIHAVGIIWDIGAVKYDGVINKSRAASMLATRDVGGQGSS